MLVLARDAAEKIMLDDPHLITLPNLKQALEAKYQRMLGADILT